MKILRWLLMPFVLFLTSWICGVLSNLLLHCVSNGLGGLDGLISQGLSNVFSGFLCTVLSVMIAPSGKKYVVWIVPLFWIVFEIFVFFVSKNLLWYNYVLWGIGLLSSLGGVWVSHKFLIDNKGDK